MRIIIDENAGVCPGVDRAIKLIEKNLNNQRDLISMGPVIHNYYEVERLKNKGLTETKEESIDFFDKDNSKQYFIRSHGIPKSYYTQLEEKGINYIDGTCSIVKRTQKLVGDYYKAGYQIVIFGKEYHPEVIGLNGYCDNTAIIIRENSDLQSIDGTRRSFLISQTTMDKSQFLKIKKTLQNLVSDIKVIDTTCRHINNREQHLIEFAKKVNVLLMVGGPTSSNTSVLFDKCYQANQRSYRIESAGEIKDFWFAKDDTIGITGSASTPLWQLELVKKYLDKNVPLRDY